MNVERIPDIDRAQFRRVLSSYPTGVVVVCAEVPEGPVGMAFNSFTSVSLDPPLVAFCPAKASRTWAAIRATSRFCISVLAAHHEQTSRRFGRVGADRFMGVPTHARAGGPAVDDAVAWIDCVLEAEHDAGDHVIAVGRVLALAASQDTPALIFWRGRYTGVEPEDAVA